jgi:hypothetical protein
MSIKMLGAAVAGLTLSMSLGAAAPAPAAAMQQYYPGPGIYCFGYDQCFPIAYSYEVYSDAEHTNLIGSGYHSCVQSGQMIFVTSPWLPSGYEVKTPMYVCSGMGPYLPSDW